MAKAKSTTKDKTKRPAASAEPAPSVVTKVTRVTTSPKRTGLASELILGALVAELVGTFVLTFALLNTGGNVVIAGVTVMVLVMAMSRLSGGHINPAVTIAMAATRQISVVKAAGYVVAQILGAMLALVIMTQFVHATPVDATTGQPAAVFTVADVTGQWRPFFAEALGALLFGMGVAAAVMGRKNSHESGFIVGGSLLVGLVIASVGSSAILNPAVAVGLSAYHFQNWWSVMAYGIAPLLGVAAGAWLYKLLQWDVTGSKTLAE